MTFHYVKINVRVLIPCLCSMFEYLLIVCVVLLKFKTTFIFIFMSQNNVYKQCHMRMGLCSCTLDCQGKIIIYWIKSEMLALQQVIKCQLLTNLLIENCCKLSFKCTERDNINMQDVNCHMI